MSPRTHANSEHAQSFGSNFLAVHGDVNGILRCPLGNPDQDIARLLDPNGHLPSPLVPAAGNPDARILVVQMQVDLQADLRLSADMSVDVAEGVGYGGEHVGRAPLATV